MRKITVVLALTVFSGVLTALASGHVPDKAELRNRVDLIYRAYQRKDKDMFASIIHPQVLQCVPNVHTDFYDSWNRVGHFEVASWQVRSIQAREDLRKHPIEDC